MQISNKQIVDAGMAFILLSSGIGFIIDNKKLWATSLVLLLINMTAPKLFTLPAKCWFKFSEILGGITSRVILSLVFFLVLLPIATLKKMFSSEDSLKLKEWKKSNASVFVVRDHEYKKTDLISPF